MITASDAVCYADFSSVKRKQFVVPRDRSA